MRHTKLLIVPFLYVSAWAQAPAPVPASAPVISPEVASNGAVTFRLKAPNAKQVNFGISGSPRVAMQKDANGIWSATTPPLEPDFYPYNFQVDGQTFADPSNPSRQSSIIEAGGSVVHVPGPLSLSWEKRDVPHGTVHHHFFKSAAIGYDTDYYVYTPPNWDPAGKDQYPVLFLLHGLGDDASAWMTVGRAPVIMDDLLADGKVKPMIVVTPYGYGLPPNLLSGGRPAMRSENSRTNFSHTVMEEILPQVERAYRVSPDRTLHAVAGLSMGGAESLFMGLNHPEQFAYVAGLSSALQEFTVGVYPGGNGEPFTPTPETYSKTFPKLDSKINSELKLLWISAGSEDANTFPVSRDLKAWFKSKGINYKSVETTGAHTWMVWRRNLTELAPLLFQ